MGQTPPAFVERSRDPMRCAPGERVIMEHTCPWCGTALDLTNRVSWIRTCPECPYEWVPPRIE